MSNAVSSATSAAASAMPSVACSANLYEIPIKDPACAMKFGGNHTDVMKGCCKNTDIVSYYDDCGLYCLAVDQSVDDLTKCLYDGGASWQDVFCSGNKTATATVSSVDPPATASASVVVSAGDTTPTDSDGKSTDAEPSSSEGAAPRASPDVSVSKMGLTVGAVLFAATAFGAFQL